METTQDQSTEGLALVHVLATVLERLCVANAAMARADPGQITKFHAMKAPGIGVLQYLERIHKYASCSNECFILALIYIDRLIQRNNFLLTELNVHRVVITAVLLAAKFFDDAYYNNAYYAKVGGVLVSEMNGLEVDFLFRINFSLHVTPDVFEKYHAELLSQARTCVSTMQQLISPPVSATVAAVPPTAHAPTSPVTSPPLICNPQAPATHNFAAVPVPPNDNPFANASSQITPPPSQNQMVYIPGVAPAGTVNVAGAPLSVPLHFTDGFTQVQRAHSCPASEMYHQPATCASSDPPYASAPAIITPALHYPITSSSADVAAMMEHQIFPLQNTLVHHNHESHHPYVIQPKADPRGPPEMLAGAIL